MSWSNIPQIDNWKPLLNKKHKQNTQVSLTKQLITRCLQGASFDETTSVSYLVKLLQFCTESLTKCICAVGDGFSKSLQ